MTNPATTTLENADIQNVQIDPSLQEQIRIRAYELYEQRGREPGNELQDWLQAETEILYAGNSLKAAA
jgi:hypothetical protein